MDIQTEHLENQLARLTVEIEPERLEQAKQRAARQIAKRVRIPGFRKGKAPYRILVQNGLEPDILQDAIESLSQDVYRESLEQSDFTPYGPGSFEDFKVDPPTFVYTVPLEPTVDLGNYRDVREEYTLPEVSDEDVDAAMKRLQEQEALVEESEAPVALGNRVTLDIHSHFADEPDGEEAEEDDEEPQVEADASDAEADEADTDDEAEDHVHAPAKGDAFIHEHGATVMLDPEAEPVLPGFNDALVGANIGEELEFVLTVPEDDENYADIAGRSVEFHVTVSKVENVTLPELNDDFAARISEDERGEDDDDEPLTLLQLRMRVRENIQKELERRTNDAYAGEVLGKMVEGATIAYPEVMIEDQTTSMLEDLDNRLGQQNMNLETYLRVIGQTEEELRAEYREPAISSIERSLVMREVMIKEYVRVPNEKIDARIDEMLVQFGEQAESLRSIFDTPQMRSNIANELINEAVRDRIIAIGRGEEPEIVIPEPEEATEAESDVVVTESDEETPEASTTAEVVAETVEAADDGDESSAAEAEESDTE